MRWTINFLAFFVLGLLLVLRRWFRAVIDGDRGPARRLRWMLAPALVVLAAFLAVAIWALLDADYPVVALLLITPVAILLEVAWQRDDRRA